QLHNWPFYREVFRAYEPVYTDDLGPWQSLPVLGATPRLLLDITGTSNPHFGIVSLSGSATYGGQFLFPVLAHAGVSVTICPRVSSLLSGVVLSLTGIGATQEHFNDAAIRYLFSVTRGEW